MCRGILLIGLVLAGVLGLRGQSQCTVTHFDEFSGMAQWYVTQIVQDRQGMMWFATWNGLNRYDGYQFECFKSQVGDGVDMPSDRIQDMMLDDDGNLLCHVETRVFGFNINTCRYHELSRADEEKALAALAAKVQRERLSADSPYVYRDPYGIEWAIHYNGRLFCRERAGSTWLPYPTSTGIGQQVYYCTTDREGNVWLKSHYGAYRLSFKKKPYTFFPQEKPTQARFFYLDQQRRYWVTNKEDATVRLFSADNRLLGYLGRDGRLHSQYASFGSPIYTMTQCADGTFWLGSKPDGLFRLKESDGGTFTVEQFRHRQDEEASLSHDHIFYLKEDRQGRLWIATFDGGLDCIEHPSEAVPTVLHKDNGLGLPKDRCLRVRQIHITDEGVLLAATTTGLLVGDISPTDVRQIRWKTHVKDSHRSSSLSNNATMYVAEMRGSEGRPGRIFVCTESGGVNQIVSPDLLADQLEFRHYSTAEGFPSDVALSAFSTDDYMLIVSNNQLIQLYPDREGADQYEAYFWKDRLRFSDACPLTLPDGRRLFGLQDGAFTIRVDDIRKSSFVPPIALTGLSVQNRPVMRAVNAMDTLMLQPSERNFTVYFAALDYSDDGDISYAFQMGDDRDQWNYIHKDRSATFLDLRPGTYQLRIRSTNGDGVWVDNVRTLTVIVRPTFWETPWATLLYIAILAAIIYIILRTRRHIHNLKRQQHELHEAYLALLNAHHPEAQTGQTAADTTAGPKLKPEDEAFMQRAVKFIEQHIGDSDINIGDMAEATATSRSGLNRKMKSLLGVTPLDFIREARIQKACQMLHGGSTVNDVAYACGFSDPKYFAKSFKAQTGLTPTEYKVQNSAS